MLLILALAGALAFGIRGNEEELTRHVPEARRLSSKVILQVILTIMVMPYLFPLVAMVQESLSGQGWGNYRAVWAVGVVPEFFRNSAIIAAGVIIIVYA